jgi:hypothetical protein
MKVVKTSISPYPNTLKRIKERGAVSTIIERDMNRLYDMYERALRQIPLTIEEACLICDHLKGTVNDPSSASILWASIEDGISLNGLDKKWGIDGQELVSKLRKLSEIQSMALIDAVERFWFGGYKKEDMAKLFMIKAGN